MQPRPFRSGIDRSKAGFRSSAAAEREQIACHLGAEGASSLLPANTGMMVRARYPAYVGEIANGPRLRLDLNAGSGARLVQQVGALRLEGACRPGMLAITPPDCAGTATCGAVDMIGLAVVPGAATWAGSVVPDHLDALASGFIDDALLASVITTLHYEAGLRGAHLPPSSSMVSRWSSGGSAS